MQPDLLDELLRRPCRALSGDAVHAVLVQRAGFALELSAPEIEAVHELSVRLRVSPSDVLRLGLDGLIRAFLAKERKRERALRRADP
jgi:hypothetical protein